MKDILKMTGVRPTLITLIWFYIFGLFPKVNQEIQNWISNPIVAVLALIGIIQLSYHDLYLAVLLGISLILSIHLGQYLDIGATERTDLYGQQKWNDSTMFESGPMGYNVDETCDNSWSAQCQGVNTFGNQFNTQGMDDIHGYGRGATYSAADF